VHPLLILAIGVAVVLGLILIVRLNAFIALITAAIVVSLLAPAGPEGVADKIGRVATAFGASTGKIGIVIALAAVIGECMMVSGAADRIVKFFLQLLGEKRAPWALMASGFVLAIPVFFDTVFYLLVPLARSLYKRTGQNYLLSLLAIVAGGAITHTLVPPTPGPLAMAGELGIDIGAMMIGGACVALPAAALGLLFSQFLDRKVPVPFRELTESADSEPPAEEDLPSLGFSILPVVLPVLLISSNTIIGTLAGVQPEGIWSSLLPYTSIIGDPSLAMLLSTAVAVGLVIVSRGRTLNEIAQLVERSLMSGGVIILITAGGGAFGAMLKVANVGPAIEGLFGESGAGGIMFLLLGYFIAVLLKIAQGSSTVAMITAAGMLKGTVATAALGYNPVYVATAIGAGSLMGSWMNDSGFWIFAKMGGLTETEALKSWTILLAALSLVSLATTILLAIILPLSG
jgi:gluconate:H+ symporter, GntP family